jgi:hypothetical protein
MTLWLIRGPTSAKPGRLLRSVPAAAVLTAGLAASFMVGAPPAWATPSPLTGEFLSAGSTSGNGGTLITGATCSQTSPSTITFTASGTVASGPYPGSFTESGVVTISTTPPSPAQSVMGIPFYQVTAVDAFFTIDSAAGTIGGTEHLDGPDNVLALCDTFNNQPFGNTGDTVSGFFRELTPGSDGYGLAYDAIIATPGGSFEDTGQSGLSIDDLNVTASPGSGTVQNSNVLNAAFASSGLIPVSGVGNATGGGQISPNGGPVAFGFEAKSDNGVLKGQCDLVDQAAGVKVHCSDVTAWAQVSPTEVKFFGDATVNGTPTSYIIGTQDLADPGIGADTFSISTGTGYTASGTLTQGNVQIHTS